MNTDSVTVSVVSRYKQDYRRINTGCPVCGKPYLRAYYNEKNTQYIHKIQTPSNRKVRGWIWKIKECRKDYDR
jgi:hypothetical protein